MEKLYSYTLNFKIEEWLKWLLKDNKNKPKYKTLLWLYNIVIKKIGKNKEEKLQKNLEELFKQEKYKLYRKNINWFQNTVWIVNELILQNWIKNFLEEEWTMKIIGDEKIFYSLNDEFEEDVFISKLSNNFYKYMWIENYFNYKYFFLFFTWKFAFEWSRSSNFKEELNSEKDDLKISLLNKMLEITEKWESSFLNIK